MERFYFLLLMSITLPLLLSSCGGGGGTSANDSPSSDVSSEIEVQTCPANLVLVGDACQCPNELTENDAGICIDWAGSVIVGAEYLEPGFPVALDLYAGFYYGPLYLKVGNIDKDPELELMYKSGSSSFLSAINYDGSDVEGWPVSASSGTHGKIVLAQLDDDPEFEVFSGYEGSGAVACQLYIFDYDGSVKPNWPVYCRQSVQIPPAAVDLNNDGYDEIIYFDDYHLNMINRSGEVQRITLPDLPPVISWSGISIADMNGDNSKEIILLTDPFQRSGGGRVTYDRRIYVLDADFNILPGFPLQFRSGYDSHPVIGDVDGDGNKEIVIAVAGTLDQFNSDSILSSIKIISHDGISEGEIHFDNWLGNNRFVPLSLADLNGDGSLEIIVSYNGEIHALDVNGINLPGWPVEGGLYSAVGDIDGDQRPELVTINTGVLTVYSANGLRKNITASILYLGTQSGEIMPVISDFDLDGRNEVILVGNFWGGYSGTYPQIWAFDFGGEDHGVIEWGQMFGDARNTGEYNTERSD